MDTIVLGHAKRDLKAGEPIVARRVKEGGWKSDDVQVTKGLLLWDVELMKGNRKECGHGN